MIYARINRREFKITVILIFKYIRINHMTIRPSLFNYSNFSGQHSAYR